MTNKQRNLLTSVLFLIFGVFMFIQSQGVKHKIASDVGSGYVPAFIAGCLIVVSVSKLITKGGNVSKGRYLLYFTGANVAFLICLIALHLVIA